MSSASAKTADSGGPDSSAADRHERYLAASPFEYRRFASREVRVGQVGVGGANPIRLQSMTISDTMDTDATVREAIELYEAGSEIVRITAPGPKDAENLRHIKAALLDRGYDFPLVADIHFSPKAALIAVEYVEKVRINPGNFADKKKFKTIEYSDAEYEDELGRVRETFRPLLLRAKELGRAMRIGTNHGSLSDRIMNRFGDTPLGMVESALEFIRFAREEDFHGIVVSMKASNPQVMVQAYRLLIERFYLEGFDYPLHLGVTEAGDGQDGRIKSAVGIGSLLDDGLGDTIRVSLTEDAIHEIPAARRIAAPYNLRLLRRPDIESSGVAPTRSESTTSLNHSEQSEHSSENVSVREILQRRFRESVNPYVYTRFLSEAVQAGACYLGSKHQHRIILPVAFDLEANESQPAFASRLSEYSAQGADAFALPIADWERVRSTPEFENAALPLIYELNTTSANDVSVLSEIARHPATAGLRVRLAFDSKGFANAGANPSGSAGAPQVQAGLAALAAANSQPAALFVHIELASLRDIALLDEFFQNASAEIVGDPRLVFSIECPGETTRACRALVAIFAQLHKDARRELPPLLLQPGSDFQSGLSDVLYQSAIHAGGLLLDGIGDAILLPAPAGDTAITHSDVAETSKGSAPAARLSAADSAELLKLSLDLLQGVRLRLSKTEFISCPSCGRTLFDLQTTTGPHQSENRTSERREDRRDGLHRKRAGRNGRRRFRLRGRGARPHSPVQRQRNR